MPATSMLSLTATGMPKSGSSRRPPAATEGRPPPPPAVSERARLRPRLCFLAQRNKDGGIGMRSDPGVAARDHLLWRRVAGAVGGENVGNGLGHPQAPCRGGPATGAPSFRCLTLLAIAQEKMRAIS